MDILDRTDNLEIDFVDDFRNKFDNSTFYNALSNFRCKRVPFLQDFMAKIITVQ